MNDQEFVHEYDMLMKAATIITFLLAEADRPGRSAKEKERLVANAMDVLASYHEYVALHTPPLAAAQNN